MNIDDLKKVPKPYKKEAATLFEKLAKIKRLPLLAGVHIRGVIKKISSKIALLTRKGRMQKRAWQTVKIARHEERPQTKDYIEKICDEFIELKGDRLFRDDPSIIGGLALIEGKQVVIIGHQKGKTTEERLHYNFGMASPEGYRKSQRLMKMAEKFSMPIITFIDTPGAFPDVGAEERGQASAIAHNLLLMSKLETPIIAIVIGEGGSGGALALGVADYVMLLKNSIYSVISPEGCAAILWRDSNSAPLAAAALKLTSKDLKKLKVIDEIIPEPRGGAQKNPDKVAKLIKKSILKTLDKLKQLDLNELKLRRIKKYEEIGIYKE